MRVAVVGAKGRMGQATCQAVAEAPDVDLVAQLDLGDDIKDVSKADVAVVFSSPDAALPAVLTCIEAGVHAVVGTTGWTQDKLAAVEKALAQQPHVGVLIAPNFAIGTLLLKKFAMMAAPHYESVEIIELHHPDKVDAPSGTAHNAAVAIAAARKDANCAPIPDATTTGQPESRGANIDGIRVHAVRLRGLVAHEEILLGAPGEVMTLRHDSMDRSCFMPGMLQGVRIVASRPGLTVGLENYLWS